MSISAPTILDWNSAPDDFSPYNAIFTSINLPSSSPNSGPTIFQIFSLQSAVRYAFCISQPKISRLFNTAIVRSLLAESLDTTDNNVIEEGTVVVFSPTTILAFLLNFSPSLISNITWNFI